MVKIKRIKIKETLEDYNFKNISKGKVGEKELSEEVGVAIETISRWNTGNVPKAIDCLFSLSNDLNIPIKDLFHYTTIRNKKILISIKIDEALKTWNKNNLGKKNITYLCENLEFSTYKVYCWKKGKPKQVPKSVVILFNICNVLDCDPNDILETYEP